MGIKFIKMLNPEIKKEILNDRFELAVKYGSSWHVSKPEGKLIISLDHLHYKKNDSVVFCGAINMFERHDLLRDLQEQRQLKIK